VRLEIAVIELGDDASAGLAGQERGPTGGCIMADGRHRAESGDDDALRVWTEQGNLLVIRDACCVICRGAIGHNTGRRGVTRWLLIAHLVALIRQVIVSARVSFLMGFLHLA